MLHNICKILGFKKIMVNNIHHREKGRYAISESSSIISFSSGWDKFI